MSGKIIVFTGDGKGKTTAAIGTAVRAAGHGKKVFMVQFLKKGEYGEKLAGIENFEIYQFGTGKFVFEPNEMDRENARKGIEFAMKLLERSPFLLILDEINVALSMGIVEWKDVFILLEKRGECHIILTGRNAPEKLIEMADLVTEMKKVKHYYDKGVKAIEGIEY